MATNASDLDVARDLIAAGEPTRAVRILRSLSPARAAEPPARLLLARALIAQGRDVEAEAVLEPLIGNDGVRGADRALAVALLAHVRAVAGDPAGALTMAADALATDGPDALAAMYAHEAISLSHLFGGDLHEAMRAASEASAAAADLPLGIRAGAVIQEAYIAFQADRFDEAARLIDEVMSAAAAQRSDGASAWVTSRARHTLGALRFHAGQWAGIEPLLDPRPDVSAGREPRDQEWATLAGLLLVVLVHTDRLDEADDLVVQSTAALATGQRPMFIWGATLLAEAHGNVAGQAALAERLLAGLVDLRSPLRLRIVGPDLVRVLLNLGDRPQASRLTNTLERVAARARVASVTAAAELCRGLLDADPSSLARAAAGFGEAERPLEQATALEALVSVSSGSDAVEPGRRAIAIYASIGARRDEVRLGKVLRDRGLSTGRPGRPRRTATGWAELSAAEVRVANLIAAGLTNVEIADRLAISARTVETHVTHTLNKLALSSRASIAAAAARQETIGRGSADVGDLGRVATEDPLRFP